MCNIQGHKHIEVKKMIVLQSKQVLDEVSQNITSNINKQDH